MIVSRSLTQEVKQKALAVGFDAVGISAVPQVRPHGPAAVPDAFLPRLLARLQQWLGWEFHATMSWMARDPDRRAGSRQCESEPGTVRRHHRRASHGQRRRARAWAIVLGLTLLVVAKSASAQLLAIPPTW